MEKVDSPMKQLSLKLVISSIASTNTFRSMMSYLHSVTIATTYRTTLIEDYSGVDFTLFNNIPMVSLHGFPGVQRITNGLENVHHLTLNIPDLMEIYEFPSSHSLQELHLLNCRDEVYHNLPVKTNFDDKFQLYSGIKKCVLVRKGYGLSHIFDVQGCVLEQSHPYDLNSLMNLEQLRISNKLSSENIFPEIPVFNGKEIVLERYCLHSWVSELKEIRCLDLYECETLETLPSMPNLLTLKLRNLPSLRIIPTFPKCHSIQLEELGALTSIHRQPKLKDLDVLGITDEIIFKELDGHLFKFVSISSSCITNFTWARIFVMLMELKH
jgi:hypothetical protein